MQNKIIGKNHVVSDPNYKYKAWYKAKNEVRIGYEVTPKTNKGDYIIEPSGKITVYAGDAVVMKPGFHAQAGSYFHAFTASATCIKNKSLVSTGNDDQSSGKSSNSSFNTLNSDVPEKEMATANIYPNPNNGNFVIQVSEHYLGGEITLFDTFGKKLYLDDINQLEKRYNFEVKPGIYYAVIKNKAQQHIQKIMIQ